MKLMIFISPLHSGQMSGSVPYTCLISAAQRLHAALPPGPTSLPPPRLLKLRGGSAEPVHPVVTGFVDDLPLPGEFDHSRLAESASQKILKHLQNPGAVSRVQSHGLIHAESRVPPAVDIRDHFPGDLAFRQEHLQHGMLPQFEKRFDGQLEQWDERPIPLEDPLTHQRVNVRVSVD